MRNFERLGWSGTVFFFAAFLAGCAGVNDQTCPAGLKPMTSAELFFGRSISEGKTVSDTDWQRFVDEEVAPRFPAGFTELDATGHWQRGRESLKEGSKLLLIVLPGLARDHPRLDEIRRAYQIRFHQESVLLFETPGCGGFGPALADVFPKM
jgi:hypothetical protein